MILCEINSFLKKGKVLDYLKRSSYNDIENVVSYLKKSVKIPIFPYDFVDEYSDFKIKVFKDEKCGLFYVIDSGKRLYFSRRFRFRFHVRRYYKNLCIEQDRRSPHCYIGNDFKVEDGSVMLDIGAAEGIFTLRNIDKISEAYCFECDDDWIEALKHTFSFCGDKVKIIKKYVSDRDDKDNMTLDSIDSSGKSYFLKMDIEGMETAALKKSMNFIKNAFSVNAAICTYHISSHEKEIESMFAGYEKEYSDGYMFFYYDKDFSEPYVRKGVMRIAVRK